MVKDSSRPSKSAHRKWVRIMGLLAGYGALLLLGHWASSWLIESFGASVPEGKSLASHWSVWLVITIYALVLSIPFIPGIEISVALLVVFGSNVVVQIYLATVAALSLSYFIGRLVPAALLASAFGAIGLRSAEVLVQRLAPLSGPERLAVLTEQAPRRFIPVLLKYRYLTFIVALNLPGNALLGGGGGIALLAGMSGLFSFPKYLLAAGLAAVPIPLMAYFLGRLV
jgi:hypothetical protein